jgi:hypothetical protein
VLLVFEPLEHLTLLEVAIESFSVFPHLHPVQVGSIDLMKAEMLIAMIS